MNLPPLINILRGCSEKEYRMIRNVIENNRPQTKGFRRNPNDIFLHYSAGTATITDVSFAPSYSGISVVEEIQSQNLALVERITELEEKISRQAKQIDDVYGIIREIQDKNKID